MPIGKDIVESCCNVSNVNFAKNKEILSKLATLLRTGRMLEDVLTRHELTTDNDSEELITQQEQISLNISNSTKLDDSQMNQSDMLSLNVSNSTMHEDLIIQQEQIPLNVLNSTMLEDSQMNQSDMLANILNISLLSLDSNDDSTNRSIHLDIINMPELRKILGHPMDY